MPVLFDTISKKIENLERDNMEISAAKTTDHNISNSTAKIGDSSQVKKNTDLESGKASKQNSDNLQGKQELTKDDMQNVNRELNKFMSIINADIQFQIHDRTKQLMVQVVNTKDHKVLKEFPSHEILDVLANIRDYVGILLDKKA